MITSLPIRYRHDELARWGLTPADAAEQVRSVIFGETVAVVNEGTNVYEIVVRLVPEHRQRIQQVKDLTLRGRDGKLVRLNEVANVGIEKASNLISRENAQRKAVISCNVAEGFNLGDLVEEVRKRVDPIVASYGYAVSYGGQFEAQQSASNTLYVMGAGVAMLILLLLNMSFGSTRAGEPGSEILAPMAIVVLGGLVSSTFLNLLVVPAGYALMFRAPRS